MNLEVQLTDRYELHPRLAWDELIAATALVLAEKHAVPFHCEVVMADVPFFEADILQLEIGAAGVDVEQMPRRKRTFEWPRLVEYAAIALAGLVIYHACRFEIKEVAVRASGGDYFVGDAFHLLEVTGRSRRRDFAPAWKQRWERLQERSMGGFFLLAVEFQTPRARLAFQP